MPVVNSGSTWARVGSMLSMRSTMMFFSEPEGFDITSPSGIFANLSSAFFRMTASTWNVPT